METKRKVLMEAGYRCAIPAYRVPFPELAHIHPWAETNDHSYENLIALCPTCHSLYDSGKIDRIAMIAYKKKLIFLNDVYSRFELDVLDYLKTHRRAIIPGELLVKRLLEEGMIEPEEPMAVQSFGSGEEILGIIPMILTDKGRQLLDDWSKGDDSLTYDRL
jgi:hypothetical protein